MSPITMPPPESTKRLPIGQDLLLRFYERRGLAVPDLEALPGHELPEPDRRLLVHSTDMTPTLENFYGQPIAITVLGREREAHHYSREVLLRRGYDQRPVEYGVIRIWLDHFPAGARDAVTSEQYPLGHILQTREIPHLSWPQGFFSVHPDAHLTDSLQLVRPQTLYGRRNLLLDGSRRLLAEVLEILAPAGEIGKT